MEQKDLNEKIAAQPYPKVTKEWIESRIRTSDYMLLPNTNVTICNITLINGFSVRGESACVDSRNFNKQIGEELAYKDAFRKLWELEGYLLADRQYRERHPMQFGNNPPQAQFGNNPPQAQFGTAQAQTGNNPGMFQNAQGNK